MNISKRDFLKCLGVGGAVIASGTVSADDAVTASARHLTVRGRVNQGSFYTPERFVLRIGEWLKCNGIDDSVTFLDSSCGDGAFFRLAGMFPKNRYIGCDIDSVAVEKCRNDFPFVKCSVRNSLLNVSRESFGIGENEKLCIVGNPPYNDTTSIVGRSLKDGKTPMDADVSSRDLGLASLLSYNKLRADYVAVLTPLSYLVKRTNFTAAKSFFSNYVMKESLVFSSQEFADTSRMSAFPILLAMYERHPHEGLCYEDVWRHRFTTLEGETFSLSDRDYVADKIDKYPHARRYRPELLFYTLRDINALMRCRTFIRERCANAVDVNPEKLPYYCYLDVFKRVARVPYWMGNFNVPYIAADFDYVSDDIVQLSKSFHPEIFGTITPPDDAAVARVRAYIDKVMSFSTKE